MFISYDSNGAHIKVICCDNTILIPKSIIKYIGIINSEKIVDDTIHIYDKSENLLNIISILLNKNCTINFDDISNLINIYKINILGIKNNDIYIKYSKSSGIKFYTLLIQGIEVYVNQNRVVNLGNSNYELYLDKKTKIKIGLQSRYNKLVYLKNNIYISSDIKNTFMNIKCINSQVITNEDELKIMEKFCTIEIAKEHLCRRII